jgi:hypothetical protein
MLILLALTSSQVRFLKFMFGCPESQLGLFFKFPGLSEPLAPRAAERGHLSDNSRVNPFSGSFRQFLF